MKRNYKFLTIAIVVMGMSFQSIGQTLEHELIAKYRFNNNANDLSGNGHNGIVIATNSTDRFGNSNSAYTFNGTSDEIEIGFLAGLETNMNQFSFSIWIKSTSNAQQTFFGCIVAPQAFKIQKETSGEVTATIKDNSNKEFRFTTTGINLNADTNWHHLVIVYENTSLSQAKVYFDNTNIPLTIINNANPTSFSTFTKKFRVGANNNAGAIIEHFKGSLDDLTIYKTALDSSEVDMIFNGNKCYQSVIDTIKANINVYDTTLVSVTDTLTIDISLDGTPNNILNTLKVYPNPTNDVLTIDNGSFSTLNGYRIKIVNLAGQEVFNSTINQQQFQINMTDFGSEGLYFLELYDGSNKKIDSRKIILN